MKRIVDAVQGTQEWHQHRANAFNASEASAMAGASQYKTRAQLLREKHSGIVPDVDAATQRRFDLGHEYEAIARPWAEEIIGAELYPVVLADEIDGMPLSASLDGLTMLEDVCWEHKTGNSGLLSSLEAGIIPTEYYYQMEQCLMLSGADKCLFMASSGDKAGMRYAWYESRPEIRMQLLSGWKQFQQDLVEYQHVEHVPEAAGSAPESLPSLRIEVTGMVTASNLEEFKAHALAVFDGIKTDPHTDQDFADADKTAKWCKDVEDRLDAAKQHALSQTASIDELFRAIDHIKEEARQKRLHLEKLVKTRKESIRTELVMDAQRKLDEHTHKLNERIGGRYIPNLGSSGFAEAIKGKKTISGCRDALDAALASAKIKMSEVADTIEINRKSLTGEAHDWMFLFPDFGQVCVKAPDDFAALLAMRIGQHREREEAAKIRAAQDEEAAIVEAMAKSETAQGREIVAVAVLDPAAKQAAVIEHQDDISTFLKARTFKDESRIRAILVEFVKHQAARALATAA